ncbi:MAG: hypothetical protein PUB22_09530 [Clostridiales bacterium]|nr:hypothetical protein [Clostridiales bacterium]
MMCWGICTKKDKKEKIVKYYIFFVDRENVSDILTIEDMVIFEKQFIKNENDDIYISNVNNSKGLAEAESFLKIMDEKICRTMGR